MMRLDDNSLRGSYPPLVTPFRNGRVDLSTFERLVERQIAGGSHGVVVAGTTAEPSSLTVQERKDLLEVAVKTVSGRIPVVAATGSQSFAETAELTRHAEAAGAQAMLVVTPYYIKPPQEGLAEYFIGIGRLTRLPILIYHIPGRASVSITAATIEKISAEIDHLVGMKHAAADLELVTETLKRVGASFRIFCGLEALSFPMMAMGASGLMNAAGNIVPERIAALSSAVRAGDLVKARELHDALFELNRAIFLDTNPIPLKYMMWRLSLLESNEVRLPLVPIRDAERQRILDRVLAQSGLLVKEAAV